MFHKTKEVDPATGSTSLNVKYLSLKQLYLLRKNLLLVLKHRNLDNGYAFYIPGDGTIKIVSGLFAVNLDDPIPNIFLNYFYPHCTPRRWQSRRWPILLPYLTALTYTSG